MNTNLSRFHKFIKYVNVILDYMHARNSLLAKRRFYFYVITMIGNSDYKLIDALAFNLCVYNYADNKFFNSTLETVNCYCLCLSFYFLFLLFLLTILHCTTCIWQSSTYPHILSLFLQIYVLWQVIQVVLFDCILWMQNRHVHQ